MAGIFLLAATWTAGCEPPGPTTDGMVVRVSGDLPARSRIADAPRGLGYGELAEVLAAVRCEEGKLRLNRLRESADLLDAQLRRLASRGPTASPKLLGSEPDRLAYWYNARAAWALKLALLESGDRTDGPVGQAAADRRRFRVDGRWMTLGEIDDLLAERFGWRAAVTAPGVRTDRAPLPERPFDPVTVQQNVRRRFEGFLDDPERVIVDVEARKVRYPEILWRFRQELVDHHHRRYRTRGATLTTALLSWVGGPAARRLQLALGYEPVLRPPSDVLDVCENPLH